MQLRGNSRQTARESQCQMLPRLQLDELTALRSAFEDGLRLLKSRESLDVELETDDADELDFLGKRYESSANCRTSSLSSLRYVRHLRMKFYKKMKSVNKVVDTNSVH